MDTSNISIEELKARINSISFEDLVEILKNNDLCKSKKNVQEIVNAYSKKGLLKDIYTFYYNKKDEEELDYSVTGAEKYLINEILKSNDCIDETNDDNDYSQYKMYVEVLRLYRKTRESDIAGLSEKLLDHLRIMLESNNDSSVYDGKNRYIFELIQNADDTKNPDNPANSLKISFYDNIIVLKYNGNIFTPRDVYSISNVFDSTKNSEQSSTIQIGEKGIGFKTVFGIAKKVTIKSGKFWFYMNRDSYILPNPCYEKGFSKTNDTTITLTLDENRPKKKQIKETSGLYWYNTIKNVYLPSKSRITPAGLLTQNPILFLNNIRNLIIENKCKDNNESLSFGIESKGSVIQGNAEEIQINISRGSEDLISCDCLKYSASYEYDRQLLKERYNHDFESNQSLNFCAIIPIDKNRIDIKNGLFYSYFPTNIKTTIPILIHAPYRLNVSRAWIDSQNNDAWYEKTTEYLIDFIKRAYLEFSRSIKQEIVYYFPDIKKRSNYKSFFYNCKEDFCERFDVFEMNLLDEKLFFSNNTFYGFPDLIWIDWQDLNRKKELESEIFEYSCLLDKKYEPKHLFDYPEGYEINRIIIKEYRKDNVISIKDFINNIYQYAFKNEPMDLKSEEIILKLISLITGICQEDEKGKEYLKDVICKSKFQYSITSLKVLGDNCDENSYIYITLREYLSNLIAETKDNSTNEDLSEETIKKYPVWNEFLHLVNSGKGVNYIRNIFSSVSCREYNVKGFFDEDYAFFLPFRSVLIINSEAQDASFMKFAKSILPDDIFGKYQIAAEIVNKENFDFLNQSISFTEAENNYVAIENTSNRNNSDVIRKFIEDLYDDDMPYKFLYELIQNADDCKYIVDEPCLQINWDINKHQLLLEYNEIGFSQDNRKKLGNLAKTTKNYTDSDTTGHMGIGLFSVFSVADRIEFISNNADDQKNNTTWKMGFSYVNEELKSLKYDEIDNNSIDIDDNTLDAYKGTKVCVHVKENPFETVFYDSTDSTTLDNEKAIGFMIKLCLCLKKLRRIKLTVTNGKSKSVFQLDITDKPNQNTRILSCLFNNEIQEYTFEKRSAEINPDEGLVELEESLKLNKPTVSCYFPCDENAKTIFANNYGLYCGLPTDEIFNSPFIIDAPFIMDSQRKKVFDSNDENKLKWNNAIRETVRKLVVETINYKLEQTQDTSLFQFLYPLIDEHSNADWADYSYYKENLKIPVLCKLSDGKNLIQPQSDQDLELYYMPEIIYEIYEIKEAKKIIDRKINNPSVKNILKNGDSTYIDIVTDLFENYIIDESNSFDSESFSYLILTEILDSTDSIMIFNEKNILMLYKLLPNLINYDIDKLCRKAPIFPVVNEDGQKKLEKLDEDKLYYYLQYEDVDAIPSSNELFCIIAYDDNFDPKTINRIMNHLDIKLYDEYNVYKNVFNDTINREINNIGNEYDPLNDKKIQNFWEKYEGEIERNNRFHWENDFPFSKAYIWSFGKDHKTIKDLLIPAIRIIDSKWNSLAQYLGYSSIYEELCNTATQESFITELIRKLSHIDSEETYHESFINYLLNKHGLCDLIKIYIFLINISCDNASEIISANVINEVSEDETIISQFCDLHIPEEIKNVYDNWLSEIIRRRFLAFSELPIYGERPKKVDKEKVEFIKIKVFWESYAKYLNTDDRNKCIEETQETNFLMTIDEYSCSKTLSYIPGDEYETLFYSEKPIPIIKNICEDDHTFIIASDYLEFAKDMNVKTLMDDNDESGNYIFIDILKSCIEDIFKEVIDLKHIYELLPKINDSSVKAQICKVSLEWLIGFISNDTIELDCLKKCDHIKDFLNTIRTTHKWSDYDNTFIIDDEYVKEIGYLLNDCKTHDESMVKELLRCLPRQIKENLYNMDNFHDLKYYDSPALKTLCNISVRSREEVIILDRINHWFSVSNIKLNYLVKYEDKLIVNSKTYSPDFHIVINNKDYYWEHLGLWDDISTSYREDNLKKLWNYLDSSIKNATPLPLLTFSEKKYVYDSKEIKVKYFLEVTSSYKNLINFLNMKKDELENTYRDLLELYNLELPGN